jgi:hypothetical protein
MDPLARTPDGRESSTFRRRECPREAALPDARVEVKSEDDKGGTQKPRVSV